MSEFDFSDQLRELLAKYYTHSKSIERELYKSEIKYRSLLEQLTDAIYFTSLDGKFLEFNKATVELLGYSYEAVSYTHLRAHETVLDLVCRLLLEKKKNIKIPIIPFVSFSL